VRILVRLVLLLPLRRQEITALEWSDAPELARRGVGGRDYIRRSKARDFTLMVAQGSAGLTNIADPTTRPIRRAGDICST
jgi:hypothetical protein